MGALGAWVAQNTHWAMAEKQVHSNEGRSIGGRSTPGGAPPKVIVYPDSARLARAAAEHFVEQAARAIRQSGRFSVALAGGSTPKAAYALLASQTYANHLDWEHIHIFWGDERCVPPDHPHSNYRMAWETLLQHVPIPAENIQRMPGELPPEQAVAEYEGALAKFFNGRKGHDRLDHSYPPSTIHVSQSFDLVLLGLGEDGHTASLFPGSPALQVTERWVTVVEHHQPPPPLVDRLSLTLPAINAAAQVTFLVSGADKAARLAQVLSPADVQPPLPAQLVRPASGNLLWLVDTAAYATYQRLV